MKYRFYFDFFEGLDDITIIENDLSIFWDDEDLDDLFYEAKVETQEDVYRIRISEDTSPHSNAVSNYEVDIAQKKPRGDSNYWWRLDIEEFLKRSEHIFPKTLESYIEDETGIEFDEQQKTI